MLVRAKPVWAQRPARKTRGWRSRLVALAISSRARGPATPITVRASETSVAAANRSASASCSLPAISASRPGRAVISHSSGPSQRAVMPPSLVVVLGATGKARPIALATRATKVGSSALPRRLTWQRYGRSLSTTSAPARRAASRAARAGRPRWASGLRRRKASTIEAFPFEVEEARLGDLGRDGAVGERHVERIAEPLAAVLDQRQRDRAPEIGAPVARGDMP